MPPHAADARIMTQPATNTARQRTAETILDATLALLERDGERRTTTNRIAAAAGISPGNLYYHYRHREAIVLAVFRRQLRALAARRAGLQADEPREAFVAGLAALAMNVTTAPGLFRALPELLVQDAQLRDLWQEWATSECDGLQQGLAALVASGHCTVPATLLPGLAAAIWQIICARAWRGSFGAGEPTLAATLVAVLAAWLDAPTLKRLSTLPEPAPRPHQSPQSSSSSPSDSS